MAAARAGDATEVIDALPDGLDTHIRPAQSGGRDLFGGEWLRITAARAFARIPADQCRPTSALDPRKEQAAYHRIRELASDRTVPLVTHRLGSTARRLRPHSAWPHTSGSARRSASAQHLDPPLGPGCCGHRATTLFRCV